MNKRHMHYLSDGVDVCEDPSRLGEDFIVFNGCGHVDGPACGYCLSLVMTHNRDMFKLESEIEIEYNENQIQVMANRSAVKPTKEVIAALAIGLVFWTVLVLTLWSVVFE